jgi:hypothetical protein
MPRQSIRAPRGLRPTRGDRDGWWRQYPCCVAPQALSGATRALRENPVTLPAGLAVVVFLVLAGLDGGYDPLRWLPATLFLLAVLVVSVLGLRGRIAAPRPVWIAAAALAAFTGWSYLSILWAEVPADAWTGANRTLLYLVVFALFALSPWTASTAAVLLGAFSLGVFAIGLWSFLGASVSDDPVGSFIAGRLAVPIAYPNGNSALYLIAAWPALQLASRREVAPLLRALFLGATGVLVELAALCQSRGSLVAVPLTLGVYLLFVPGRLRSILSVLPVAVAAAAATPILLRVYEAVVSGDNVQESLVDARSAIIWSFAALLVVGGVIGYVDRAVRVPDGVSRTAGIVVIAAIALAFVGGSAALVQRYGDPVDTAAEAWDRFSGGRYLAEAEVPHFVSGFGSGRYDIWRVAVELFAAHPVVGIGADNFAVDYLREREGSEEPLYPHSVALRTLSQTGVVGSAMLLAFLGALAFAWWRSLHRGSQFGRAVAGAAATMFVFWLVYGMIDWFWEIPALAAPVFAFGALATRLGEPRGGLVAVGEPDGDAVGADGSQPDTAGSGRRIALFGGLALAALVAAVSVGAPWLAARQIEAAADGWSTDPGRAFDRLDQARFLDPLTDQADVYAAVIAAQGGDVTRQRAALLRAVERNPLGWYQQLELGLLAARSGDRPEALDRIAKARLLNPLEPVTAFVEARVRAGNPPTQAEVDRKFVERVDLLVGSRQG